MCRVVEKTWYTKAGLRACCLFVNDSHRCGYIAVDEEHPLYEVKYSQSVECLKAAYEKCLHEPMGKKGIIAMFCAAGDPEEERWTPELVFSVHGGLTFSKGNGKYPIPGNGLWWFGFDCAHLGDGTTNPRLQMFYDGPVRDLEYVVGECESLAEQLMTMFPSA